MPNLRLGDPEVSALIKFLEAKDSPEEQPVWT